jgi:hypothetical protein
MREGGGKLQRLSFAAVFILAAFDAPKTREKP